MQHMNSARDEHRPSFVKAAVTTYGTNITVAVLGLVNVLIVARVLGPSGRGDVALLITIGMISSFLAACGIQEANANIGGFDPERRASLATNSVLLAFLLGGAAAGVVAGLTAVFPRVGGEVPFRLLLWALAAIVILLLRTYLIFLVQANCQFRHHQPCLAGQSGRNRNPQRIAGSARDAVGGLGDRSMGAGADVGSRPARHSRSQAHRIRAPRLAACPPLALLRSPDTPRPVHGCWHVSHRPVVRRRYRGIARIWGRYSVAVAWAEVLYYVSGVLVMIQRPDLVRASRDEAARVGAKVSASPVCIALPLALGLGLAAPYLCVTIFGPEFADRFSI